MRSSAAAPAVRGNAARREGTHLENRIIVFIFNDTKGFTPSIACLDFVGTTRREIETHFRHWASPDAAKQGGDASVQGGHGNGGKCYMTQLFKDHAIFVTVRNGKGNRYGVKGGAIQFGYVPDLARGRDYAVQDLRDELDAALTDSGLTTDQLPREAQRALASAPGFTLVRGVGPKHYDRKIRVRDLIAQVRDHTQMLTTLEFCDVFVIHNGEVLSDLSPLRPTAIEAIPGAEEPRSIPIPEFLSDPTDGERQSTTDQGRCELGILHLRTSDTSMRWKKKSRHTINYKSDAGFIGYRSMLEFPVQSGYRDKIYGECVLSALDDYKQNDRGALANAPLTRAVDNFIAEEVERYASEFEAKDKKKYSKQERNALSEMNQALDKWKNQFIKNFIDGAFGSGGVAKPPPLPAGKPVRIDVVITHPRLGLGVAIRPIIRFYDGQNRQIRPVPFRWVSEDTNVALVDDDLMIVNSFSPGETAVYAETLDGNLLSNKVSLQVVKLRSVSIEPAVAEVKVGARTQLIAHCTLSNGEVVSDVALIWTESDPSIARVSSVGLVYGASQGQTEIIAGDDKVTAATPSAIHVVETDETDSPKKGKGRQRGAGGYPLILVSGDVDEDPDTGEYVQLTPDTPPIYQRPEDTDRNIWWINSASPLARMYLSKELGYGYDSREWRMYHLERYIEIITQIAVRFDPNVSTGPLTVSEFFLYCMDKSADVQAAIAQELAEFIREGVIPKVS